MPRREMRWAGQPAISVPANRIWPALGGRSPDSRLSKVVLPAPLGPITQWTSPARTARLTPSTAMRPPKRLVNPSVRSATSAIAPLRRAGGTDGRWHILRLHGPPVASSEQSRHAMRQQQNDDDDEDADAQQPILGIGLKHLLEQHKNECTEHR